MSNENTQSFVGTIEVKFHFDSQRVSACYKAIDGSIFVAFPVELVKDDKLRRVEFPNGVVVLWENKSK